MSQYKTSAHRKRAKPPKKAATIPILNTDSAPPITFRETRHFQKRNTSAFQRAFALEMRRYGDTPASLFAALSRPEDRTNAVAIRMWRTGKFAPRRGYSFEFLNRIEKRYGLPKNYFRLVLLGKEDTILKVALREASEPHRRIIRWHVPEDFELRSINEQKEIISWIRSNALSCTTEFGRYQKWTRFQTFSIRFSAIIGARQHKISRIRESRRRGVIGGDHGNHEVQTSIIEAPERISEEMVDFVAFKTSPLAPPGYRRISRWNGATVSIKVKQFSVLFGGLVASPKSSIAGLGLSPEKLTFALLVFPAIWDWFFAWRADRRGFFTSWEWHAAQEMMALSRRQTGWLRQHPELARRLFVIPGFISHQDIDTARRDWASACDSIYSYAREKVREIKNVSRIHRDTFEPVLAILKAPSPLAEYRKISDEILRRLPNERKFPLATAEAVRSYLMLRLAMHLGVRQRNLRDLFLCPPGNQPRTERQLQIARHGEIRWSDAGEGWEVFIPAASFKNGHSSFFGQRPFQLLLPNLAGLNSIIESYVARHRPVLLGGFPDPGNFFVRTVRSVNKSAPFNDSAFYESWKLTVQLYGIYNPYTGRGAIKGLLPHGPNNVRDVLATHVLKQTGSYGMAAYAIQDVPETILKHYGRFLPHDKLAQAAEVLNQVWKA